MKYTIKQAAWHFFNNDTQVLNEDGSFLFLLKATGSFFGKLMSPEFKVIDESGNDVLIAKHEKSSPRNRHVLCQQGAQIGVVEESSPRKYTITGDALPDLSIQLAGKMKGWDLSEPNGVVAHIVPSLKKWGWSVDCLSDENRLPVLVGLALIYGYFQDA